MIFSKLVVSAAISAAVLGVGAWGVNLRADLKEAQAEMRYPPEGAFVEIAGRQVHYVTRGNGPDVVIVHGAGGSTRDYSFSFLDELAATYRVTVFDRPGFGWSERIRPDLDRGLLSKAESIDEQADHLSAAAKAIGIETPILMGQSYGNAVALAWALRHDVAAVVSVSGVSHPWPGSLGPQYRINGSVLGGAVLVPLLAAFPPTRLVEPALGRIFEPNSVPEGYADYFGIAMYVRRSTLWANARQVNTLRPQIVKQAQHYPGLTIPIEIVHGSQDTIVPAQVHSIPFSDRVPSANLVMLEGIGHMPHHSAPKAVVAAIDRAATRAGLR